MNRALAAQAPPRLGWWDERVIGFYVPQPNELIAHAALNFPADIWLDTPEALERVIKSYVAHCREVGRFVHTASQTQFNKSTYSGYRGRLREYRECQAYYLRKAAAQSDGDDEPRCNRTGQHRDDGRGFCVDCGNVMQGVR